MFFFRTLLAGLSLAGLFLSDIQPPAELQQLYAYSAVLFDCNEQRVLFEKNGYEKLPIASTTKIMTLLVVLSLTEPEEFVTVSKHAASQPDVQLGIRAGEKYKVKDLCYSLMLESHNDSAVALAEHACGTVEKFAEEMNAMAKAFSAPSAFFVTPNGLDEGENGCNARDLAVIASKAIENEEFIKITNTESYSFSERTTGRSFTVSNKNQFLHMMDGAIGIKTGFTGKAGYCFVGAVKKEEYKLISVVLACGWPPHKGYKWTDTKRLMEYGIEDFSLKKILDSKEKLPKLREMPVKKGRLASVSLTVSESELEKLLSDEILLSDSETISFQVSYDLSLLKAPVYVGSRVGTLLVLLDNTVIRTLPIETEDECLAVDFTFFFQKVFNAFFKAVSR